jgi:secondary thiamine-phosphate synthase enzyme
VEAGVIREFSVKTRDRSELVDITERVRSAVEHSGVKDGICVVYLPHTTAGILINENESGFLFDLLKWLDEQVPVQGAYRHPDGNAHAHIKASLIGISKHLAIRDGRLALGTWQSVFLSEFDGPRTRTVLVKTLEG